MRVLFTGGGGAGTSALWNLLGGRYEIHAADADPARISPIIPRDRAHRIPMGSDPNFLTSVRELCTRIEIDVLVPGVDEELLPLAEDPNSFQSTRVLLPDKTFVSSMLDKLTFAELMVSRGIPVPRTVRLDRSETWTDFPCIVKPRRGRGSRGVTVVSHGVELRSIAAGLGVDAAASVVQELIAGDEYSVQVFAGPDGALRAVVPANILIKRGITISAVTKADEGIRQACNDLHSAFPTSGIYNVQGMLTQDGQFLAFEINPRVSTTLCLAVAAGIDVIELSCAAGEQVSAREGIRLDRFWTNVFSEMPPGEGEGLD